MMPRVIASGGVSWRAGTGLPASWRPLAHGLRPLGPVRVRVRVQMDGKGLRGISGLDLSGSERRHTQTHDIISGQHIVVLGF